MLFLTPDNDFAGTEQVRSSGSSDLSDVYLSFALICPCWEFPDVCWSNSGTAETSLFLWPVAFCPQAITVDEIKQHTAGL